MSVSASSDLETLTTYYDGYARRQLISSFNNRHLWIWRQLRQRIAPEASVLEIGCGVGAFTTLLASAASRGRVVAFDLSPESVEIARELNRRHRHVVLRAATATSLPTDGAPYDFVLALDVLEHVPVEAHAAVLTSASQCLAPDGELLVTIPNPQLIEHLEVHDPSQLQELDQALDVPVMMQTAQACGLRLRHFETYGIELDEQYHLLRFVPERPWVDRKPVRAATSSWERLQGWWRRRRALKSVGSRTGH